MGYTWHLEVDTGGDAPGYLRCETTNYTYNVGNMYHAVGLSLNDLGRIKCKEVAPKLLSAIKALEADPERFKAMNPPNGWGDYDGAIAFLKSIRVECQKHPEAFLKIT